MKVEPAPPLLAPAVVGTCAPLVHRLTGIREESECESETLPFLDLSASGGTCASRLSRDGSPDQQQVPQTKNIHPLL